MARSIRIEYPGAFYHVFSRGNEKRVIFQDNQDYKQFLQLLEEAALRWELNIHAYALMDNHYHLVIETKSGMLSKPMRHINGVYTQYFNHRHDRVGHLFQGRFKALLIEKDSYLLTLSRYVHQNPAKAKLVEHPEEYPWSSYRAFLDLEPIPIWLNTQETLIEFGDSAQKQKYNYKRFVETGDEIDPFKEAVGQLVLGSKEFFRETQEKIEKICHHQNEYSNRNVLLPKLPQELILSYITRTFDIKQEDLLGRRWSRDVTRPMTIKLLRDQSRLPITTIAKLFNISSPATSLAIKRLETKMRKLPNLQEQYFTLTKKLVEKLKVKT